MFKFCLNGYSSAAKLLTTWGLLSKETVVLRRWVSETQTFGFINWVGEGKLAKAYSGTLSRRNCGRLKATLGDLSKIRQSIMAILSDFRRLKAILGDLRQFWAT